MKSKISASFILFLICLFISLGTIAATYLYHYYNVRKENLIYLGFSQSLVFAIAPVGIYIGFKSVGKRLNKIGLWGNVSLMFYTIGLMLMALL